MILGYRDHNLNLKSILVRDIRFLISSKVTKMPERYLPVHPSMPAALCSQPVNLVSVSAVEEFLADTLFASRSITELTGGYINYVYRIHLLTPFEGGQTVVLKHAQPFWKSSVVKAWEVGRQVRREN